MIEFSFDVDYGGFTFKEEKPLSLEEHLASMTEEELQEDIQKIENWCCGCSEQNKLLAIQTGLMQKKLIEFNIKLLELAKRKRVERNAEKKSKLLFCCRR